MAALTFPIMVAALAGRVSIPASDPNMQYIGRMVSAADGTVQFDMPGCEIRTVMTLTSGTSCPTCSDDAHVTASPCMCACCACAASGACARVTSSC
jgi:Tfp pilus assembly protein PilV